MERLSGTIPELLGYLVCDRPCSFSENIPPLTANACTLGNCIRVRAA